MPEQYRKKPVVVNAMRFVGDSSRLYEVYKWIADIAGVYYPFREDDVQKQGISVDHNTGDLLIKTLEGVMRCEFGDWVIQGVHGEFYPCKNDIFEKTYEFVGLDNDQIPELVEEVQKMDHSLSPYDEMVKAIDTVEKRKKRHGPE